MDLDLGSAHAIAAYTAVVLGVVAPVLAFLYGVRVERRQFWRIPMLAGGVATMAAAIAVLVLGRQQVSAHPRRLLDPQVLLHLDYADRLLLPAVGFGLFALFTALLNARTGALRILLPWLTVGFGAVVLGLTVLGSNSDARLVVDQVLAQL